MAKSSRGKVTINMDAGALRYAKYRASVEGVSLSAYLAVRLERLLYEDHKAREAASDSTR